MWRLPSFNHGGDSGELGKDFWGGEELAGGWTVRLLARLLLDLLCVQRDLGEERNLFAE